MGRVDQFRLDSVRSSIWELFSSLETGVICHWEDPCNGGITIFWTVI